MTTISLRKIESDIYNLFEKEFSARVKKDRYIEQLRDQNMTDSEIEDELYEEMFYEEWDYVYRDCMFEVATKYAGNILDAEPLFKYLEDMSTKYDWFETAVDDVIRSVIRN